MSIEDIIAPAAGLAVGFGIGIYIDRKYCTYIEIAEYLKNTELSNLTDDGLKDMKSNLNGAEFGALLFSVATMGVAYASTDMTGYGYVLGCAALMPGVLAGEKVSKYVRDKMKLASDKIDKFKIQLDDIKQNASEHHIYFLNTVGICRDYLNDLILSTRCLEPLKPLLDEFLEIMKSAVTINDDIHKVKL